MKTNSTLPTALRVVMLGSGNVATSLAPALARHHRVVQVYSRNVDNARKLATAVSSDNAINDTSLLVRDADVYIISVVDDAVRTLAEEIPDNGALWLHTSGSVPMDVFAGHRRRYGVLYPLQSFSRQMPVALDDVHIFVEGNNEAVTADIVALAHTLTPYVTEATSHDRKRLHVAAVFACNFVNHMATLATEVLDEGGLPTEAMLPLLRTTVAKLDRLTPQQSQTGPAVRHDEHVIASHLALLTGDKHDLYERITRSIQSRIP